MRTILPLTGKSPSGMVVVGRWATEVGKAEKAAPLSSNCIRFYAEHSALLWNRYFFVKTSQDYSCSSSYGSWPGISCSPDMVQVGDLQIGPRTCSVRKDCRLLINSPFSPVRQVIFIVCFQCEVASFAGFSSRSLYSLSRWDLPPSSWLEPLVAGDFGSWFLTSLSKRLCLRNWTPSKSPARRVPIRICMGWNADLHFQPLETFAWAK
jgi:hypothetical protein